MLDELCAELCFEPRQQVRRTDDVQITNDAYNGKSNDVEQPDLSPFLDDGHVLVFDVESTSLKGTAIQCALLVATHAGDIKYVYSEHWYTDEAIDPRSYDVHRIGHDLLRQRGLKRSVEVARTIGLLETALSRGVQLVAHNATFDVETLRRTAMVHDVAVRLEREDVLCTMQLSRQHCKLMNVAKRVKNPSNVELYMHFFHTMPAGKLHDAEADARITLASFVQGRMYGYW